MADPNMIHSSKYLSPPISPEPKHGCLQSLFGSTSKSLLDTDVSALQKPNRERKETNGPIMYILPANTNIKRHQRFLAAYGFKLAGKKKNDKTKKEAEKQKQKPSVGTPSSLSSSSSSDDLQSGQPTRPYLTRSKRPRSLEGIESSTRKSSKYNNFERVFESRLDFLENSTVLDVHGLPVEDIPDFAPSCKKIDFKRILKKVGIYEQRSLRDERYLDLIPEKELSIVFSINLTPSQYIDTKKRFFAEKARKRFNSKSFKKTDAQKACRIDVNKASKLFEVFQIAGLLENDLYIEG